MAWFIGQSILMIAAAFLLGLLVGWLIWGRLLIRRTSTTTIEAAPPAAPVEAAHPVATPTAPVEAARPVPTPAAPVEAARPVATPTAPVEAAPPTSAPAAATSLVDDAAAAAASGGDDAARAVGSVTDEPAVAVIPEPRTSPEDASEPVVAVTAGDVAGDDEARDKADDEVVSEPAVDAVTPEPEPEPAAAADPVIPEPEPVVVAGAEPEPAAVAVLAKPQGKRKSRKAAPAAEASVETAVEASAQASAEVEPDDLERIEGIGPAMSRALIGAGIRTYGQLAEADDDTLRDAIKAKGLKFAPSLVTWARQARLLADGDEAGFAELTRRLVAGRDEGRE